MVLAGAAWAQFEQYIGPGTLGVQPVPTKERFEDAMKEAPYRLGALRLGLCFALQDVSWVSNVYGTTVNPVSDFTATASFGVHAYLPAGPKLVFALYALPEYVWWHDLSYLRSWNGKYGLGVFGYFNRVTLELQAGDWRTQEFYSTVNPIPVNEQQQRGAATLEVAVLGRLSLFGNLWQDRWRYENQTTLEQAGEILQLSDRNETLVGGGLRYRFADWFALAISYESLTTDFLTETASRSNSGGGPTLEFDLKAHHLWAAARLTDLSLRAEGGSGFPPFDGTTGHVQVGWKPGAKLEWQLYGGRNLSYTLFALDSYYVDQRWGLGLQSPLGWRTTARIFWEQGRDEYPPPDGSQSTRTTDFASYGVTLSVEVGSGMAVQFEGSRTSYSSIVSDDNRAVTRILMTLNFAGAGSQWW
jgi:hypothetical protein